jgi:hypothetical protein
MARSLEDAMEGTNIKFARRHARAIVAALGVIAGGKSP